MVWAAQGGCPLLAVEEGERAREAAGTPRGGAIGAPESRNMLGMLVVMSL